MYKCCILRSCVYLINFINYIYPKLTQENFRSKERVTYKLAFWWLRDGIIRRPTRVQSQNMIVSIISRYIYIFYIILNASILNKVTRKYKEYVCKK